MFEVDNVEKQQDQLIVDFENELKNINPLSQSLHQNHNFEDSTND